MDSDLRDLSGDAARRHTSKAAIEISDAVRSTLGPQGLDKMLVDHNGKVVVTNKGGTVIQELAMEDPVGKVLLSMVNEQIKETSDGTTTAILLVGELLTRAIDLFDQGFHPTTIAEGYDLANSFAKREMVDLAIPIDVDDDETLLQIGRNAANGRSVGSVTDDDLAEKAVETVRGVTEDDVADLDLVKSEKIVGDATLSMDVLRGAIVTEDPSLPDMPVDLPDASILLLSGKLKAAQSEADDQAIARIADSDRFDRLRESTTDRARAVAERVCDLGVDAVFCVGADDGGVSQYLADANVLVVTVSGPKVRFLETVTAARAVPDVERATPDDLGRADVSYDRKDDRLQIEGNGTPGVTISVRGAVKQIVDELKRGVTDTADSIGAAVDDGFALAGGGATEAELAQRLRTMATDVSDRRQFVVEAFAEGVEAIPKQLAKNAGMDPMDVIVALRNEHADGNIYAGIDPEARTLSDMRADGVLEPVSVKATGLTFATEAASTVLRIDGTVPAHRSQVLLRSEDEEDEGKPGGDDEDDTSGPRSSR